MAQGYEGRIVLQEQWKGWGDTTNKASLELLEPESETLDYNMNEKIRTNKIRGVRQVRLSDVSNDYVQPAGDVVLQPRNPELAMLLMSHFQAVRTESGTVIDGTWSGTMTFVPCEATPDFLGSQFGTFDIDGGYAITSEDIYALRVLSGFGTLEGQAPESVKVFENGYVESMNWTVTSDEDLIVTSSLNFRGTNPSQGFLVATSDPSSNFVVSGLRYTGINGTVTWDGTSNSSNDIESWNMTTVTGGNGAGRIGAGGFQRFPFTGEPAHTGNFSLELKASKMFQRQLSGTGTFSLTIGFGSKGAGLPWVTIEQPTCRFNPYTPNNSGAQNRIDFAPSYRAYGNNGTPATIISMYLEYGTSLMSIDIGSGANADRDA